MSFSPLSSGILGWNGSIGAPPRRHLETLAELVKSGDIMGIRRELDAIEAEDARHAAFLAPLRQYAATFQMRQIRDYVASHLT